MVATYDLWPTDVNRARVAKIDVELSKQEGYDINIDPKFLAISPDALSFSIAHRVWRLRPPKFSTSKDLAQAEWPSPVRFDTVLIKSTAGRVSKRHILYRSLVKFSPSGKYITLTQQWYTDVISDFPSQKYLPFTRITAFEVIATRKKIVKRILHRKNNNIELKPQRACTFYENNSEVWRHTFHPTLPLCAFFAMLSLDKTLLILWNFESKIICAFLICHAECLF